jgi:hypothetical protein
VCDHLHHDFFRAQKEQTRWNAVSRVCILARFTPDGRGEANKGVFGGQLADAFVSSASGLSTDDDETDDDSHTVIGRRGSVSVSEARNSGGETNQKPPRPPSPQPPASGSDGLKANHCRNGTLNRRTFTRSRSPAPQSLGMNGIMPQPPLPSSSGFLRPRGPAIFVLPGILSLTLSSWMVPWHYQLRIDARLAGEGAILMFALVCASQKLRSSPSALLPSDDELPIGTVRFASPWSAHHDNHVHVRTLRCHLCLLHIHGLESLFLHTNTAFIESD